MSELEQGDLPETTIFFFFRRASLVGFDVEMIIGQSSV